MDQVKLSPGMLTEAIALIADGTISSKIAKELLPELLEGAAEGSGVAALVEQKGMGQISDPEEIKAVIQKVMDANPKQVEEFRCGCAACGLHMQMCRHVELHYGACAGLLVLLWRCAGSSKSSWTARLAAMQCRLACCIVSRLQVFHVHMHASSSLALSSAMCIPAGEARPSCSPFSRGR